MGARGGGRGKSRRSPPFSPGNSIIFLAIWENLELLFTKWWPFVYFFSLCVGPFLSFCTEGAHVQIIIIFQ